jgi:hypothetical protein
VNEHEKHLGLFLRILKRAGRKEAESQIALVEKYHDSLDERKCPQCESDGLTREFNVHQPDPSIMVHPNMAWFKYSCSKCHYWTVRAESTRDCEHCGAFAHRCRVERFEGKNPDKPLGTFCKETGEQLSAGKRAW